MDLMDLKGLSVAYRSVSDRISVLEDKLSELSLYLQGDPETETAKRTMLLYDGYDRELTLCKRTLVGILKMMNEEMDNILAETRKNDNGSRNGNC